MRSSRPRNARAQDDRLKNSFDGIFRNDPIPFFFNQTKMKNIYSRIDNPSPSFFSKERGKKRRNSLPPGERQKK